MSPDKPRRLGRGLEALLGTSQVPPVGKSSAATSAPAEFQRLPLAQIRANPFQPRHEFAESDLAELKASIAASGLLQPVVVRHNPNGVGFELISGERRFRAASALGWTEIPALIKTADERTMLTLALIENLQRTDLNVAEEARGYQRLSEEFHLTHQQISESVGKDRSTITNLLRLLSLPAAVLQRLERGELSMGHARALLTIADQGLATRLAADIVAQELSVRETERRVRAASGPSASLSASRQSSDGKRLAASVPETPALRQLTDRLRKKLQTDIKIRADASGKGTVEIAIYSHGDLERIMDLLLGQPSIGD